MAAIRLTFQLAVLESMTEQAAIGEREVCARGDEPCLPSLATMTFAERLQQLHEWELARPHPAAAPLRFRGA